MMRRPRIRRSSGASGGRRRGARSVCSGSRPRAAAHRRRRIPTTFRRDRWSSRARARGGARGRDRRSAPSVRARPEGGGRTSRYGLATAIVRSAASDACARCASASCAAGSARRAAPGNACATTRASASKSMPPAGGCWVRLMGGLGRGESRDVSAPDCRSHEARSLRSQRARSTTGAELWAVLATRASWGRLGRRSGGSSLPSCHDPLRAANGPRGAPRLPTCHAPRSHSSHVDGPTRTRKRERGADAATAASRFGCRLAPYAVWV